MGYEEPSATFGLFLVVVGGGGGDGLREDGDTAGARTGGEERGMGVESIEEGDDGCIDIAFGRFVWLCFVYGF